MTNQHDKHINNLVEQIKDSYLIVLKNVQYKEPTHVLGEIDVLAIGKDQFDIYEVKSNRSKRSIRKACRQLKSARDYLGQEGREFLYTPQEGIEPLEKLLQERNS